MIARRMRIVSSMSRCFCAPDHQVCTKKTLRAVCCKVVNRRIAVGCVDRIKGLSILANLTESLPVRECRMVLRLNWDDLVAQLLGAAFGQAAGAVVLLRLHAD